MNEKVPQQVQKAISQLPKEQQMVLYQALFSKQHSGPLPDGETLEAYNKVIPNGGDRLMKTVELQIEHRIAMEKDAERRTFNQRGVGQVMGFAIALVFGAIAWDLARRGYGTVAAILGSIDLVALVTVFAAGKDTKEK